MKSINRIIVVIIGGLFPIILLAQSNPLDGMIKKYADQPGFYFLDMKTNIFNSVTDDKSATTTNKFLTVKMLTYNQDSSSQYKSSEIYEQFNSNIDLDSYKGLIEVKTNGDKVDIMVKKDGDKISDIILIIRESTETVFISASGSFDLKDIAKLSEMKNCRGLDTLQKLCED